MYKIARRAARWSAWRTALSRTELYPGKKLGAQDRRLRKGRDENNPGERAVADGPVERRRNVDGPFRCRVLGPSPCAV